MTTFDPTAQDSAFFKSLVLKTIQHFTNYQNVVKYPKYLFGEQQTKTAITMALGDICQALMQESL